MASKEQQARFLAAASKDSANSVQNPARKSGLRRGKRPRNESFAKAMENSEWKGMKRMALYLLGPDAVCGICEEPLHNGQIIDADHIIPKGRGGKSDPENLQLVHRTCHNRKHRNLPEWSKSA